MTTKNLWGNIDVGTAPASPVVILQGQASKLEEITSGVLTANVERSSQSGAKFFASLEVVAPYLYNYRLAVLELSYPPEVFPLQIRDLVSGLTSSTNPFGWIQCDDEDEFVQILGDILQASKLHRILAALVSHSQAERSDGQASAVAGV